MASHPEVWNSLHTERQHSALSDLRILLYASLAHSSLSFSVLEGMLFVKSHPRQLFRHSVWRVAWELRQAWARGTPEVPAPQPSLLRVPPSALNMLLPPKSSIHRLLVVRSPQFWK